MIRRIAVLTGDDNAPGMNGVIRAVTRTALSQGWEVLGVCDGYTGLVDGEFVPLSARAVDSLMPWGSTVLGCTEGKRFSIETEQRLALQQLAAREIDALIVVGGAETQAAAHALSLLGFPVNGITASVENDLAGFDMAVGVDSAMNVALESIDHVRLTRPGTGVAFLVEVAGRKSGYLALMSGLAASVDLIVIPEVETTLEHIGHVIQNISEAGKPYSVIVSAECAAYHVDQIRHFLESNASPDQKSQVTRLGYLQRRAAPNAFDRLLGTRLGACAVEAMARGEQGVLAGAYQGQMRTIPYDEVVGIPPELDAHLLQLADHLSFGNFAAAQAH